MVSSCSVRALDLFTEKEEEKEDGEIVDLADSRIYCLRVLAIYYYREIEYSSSSMMVYFKRLWGLGFVSLEALKMYYVCARSRHPYIESTDSLIINSSMLYTRLYILATAVAATYQCNTSFPPSIAFELPQERSGPAPSNSLAWSATWMPSPTASSKNKTVSASIFKRQGKQSPAP